MIWILMIMISGNMMHDSNPSQMSVEFNTKEACLEAARTWQKTVKSRPVFVLCAAKGEKK